MTYRIHVSTHLHVFTFYTILYGVVTPRVKTIKAVAT